MNAEQRFVGIQPWFPGPLCRWRWLTEPIAAERVAALRIVTALVVLLDICIGYLPHFVTLFSADNLGGRDLYAARFRDGHYFWSLLRWLPDSWGPTALLAVWAAAAIALLIGWRTVISGLIVWACAVSFWNINLGVNNGGDRLRNTILLMVALSNCGAVWGVNSVRKDGDTRPVVVPGWPVKVLFVQLAVLYFFGGLYKLLSPAWRSGYVMYFVSHDLEWCTTPAQSSLLPVWVHQLTGWVTLIWELGFPILAVMHGTRMATLWLGVAFHLLTFFTLEVGAFALYAIACYVPFLYRCGLARGESPVGKPTALSGI